MSLLTYAAPFCGTNGTFKVSYKEKCIVERYSRSISVAQNFIFSTQQDDFDYIKLNTTYYFPGPKTTWASTLYEVNGISTREDETAFQYYYIHEDGVYDITYSHSLTGLKMDGRKCPPVSVTNTTRYKVTEDSCERIYDDIEAPSISPTSSSPKTTYNHFLSPLFMVKVLFWMY